MERRTTQEHRSALYRNSDTHSAYHQAQIEILALTQLNKDIADECRTLRRDLTLQKLQTKLALCAQAAVIEEYEARLQEQVETMREMAQASVVDITVWDTDQFPAVVLDEMESV